MKGMKYLFSHFFGYVAQVTSVNSSCMSCISTTVCMSVVQEQMHQRDQCLLC